VSSGN